MFLLQRAVAERIGLAGITRRQIEAACAAVPQVTWGRLPLVTDEALGNVALQAALVVRLRVEFEVFVDVYEEFVAGYILTHELRAVPPPTRLRKRLELSKTQASYLFGTGAARPGPRPVTPRTLAMNALALAALALWTFEGEVVESGPASFLVTAGGMRFGIHDGCPAVNLGKRPLGPHIEAAAHSPALVQLGRTGPSQRQPSGHSVYTQLAAWGLQNEARLGVSLAAWSLALNILRSTAHGNEYRRLTSALRRDREPAATRHALRLARGFREFDQPWSQLRVLLVPMALEMDEFVDLFGARPRGSVSARWAEWDVALDHLNEKESA